ncbi:MAG: hypothetical protein ACR2OH_07795, partial [Microthrixaceae bacterium]
RPSLRLVSEADPTSNPPAEAAASDDEVADKVGGPSKGATTPSKVRGRVRDGEKDPEPTTEGSQDPLEAAQALLDDADAEAAYKALLSLTRTGHSDLLQTLEYTPALEFHDPRCVKVDPEPQGLDAIDLYAHAAFPDFDRILLEPFNDPRNDHLLNHLRHLLFNEGENVALVTNHGQIIDIALVLGALLTAMCNSERTFGVLGDRVELDELADRNNVLVSRMVATQAALGVPAMQVLQIGARTFLSIPQTASRRRARLDSDLVRANNTVMRHELEQQMAKGGQMLAMAASGSQDLSMTAGLIKKARDSWLKRRGEEPPEASTLHLQPLYDGTMKLMQSCEYVLPVAISLDPANPCCVLGEMTRLTERDDCHRVMDWIAQAHQDATGTPTLYHWHEDDLLTQVRSLARR